jgi:ankyrin repeat protein
VWSRRTSARYQQLTSEKLQKDLIEKERAAAEETARITVCLFPDVLDVTAPCVKWCEDDTNCSTALVERGNTRCLRHLLDSSFDPSTVSVGGVTLAMIAARNGHYHVLDMLMERELDLRGRDDCGKNVLHYAAICTKGDVVSYLLTHPKSQQCKKASIAS